MFVIPASRSVVITRFRGHHLGAVAGPDLGAVLVEARVPEPVQRLDRPIAAGSRPDAIAALSICAVERGQLCWRSSGAGGDPAVGDLVATGVDADAVRSISQAQVSDQLSDNDPRTAGPPRTVQDG
jgi:hypothetical protein